jgi:DNA-binding MarR family transcriptional regulator
VTRTIHDQASIPAAAQSAGAERVLAIFAEFRGALGVLRCGASQRLVKLGVSMTQIHILSMLEHHGEMAMSRLAEMLDVSDSNATGLVDRLAERGLVERVRDLEDRRVVTVRPSQKGRDVLDEVQLMRDDLLRQVLARLEPEQAERLADALADVRDAVVAEVQEGFGGSMQHAHTGTTTRGITT